LEAREQLKLMQLMGKMTSQGELFSGNRRA